jgi:hypothetical protein
VPFLNMLFSVDGGRLTVDGLWWHVVETGAKINRAKVGGLAACPL